MRGKIYSRMSITAFALANLMIIFSIWASEGVTAAAQLAITGIVLGFDALILAVAADFR